MLWIAYNWVVEGNAGMVSTIIWTISIVTDVECRRKVKSTMTHSIEEEGLENSKKKSQNYLLQ